MAAMPGLPSSLLARSWSRYWAKVTDLFIFTNTLNFFVAMQLPRIYEQEFFYGAVGKQLYSVLLLPFALILDAIVLFLIGNTPGKKIAGEFGVGSCNHA